MTVPWYAAEKGSGGGRSLWIFSSQAERDAWVALYPLEDRDAVLRRYPVARTRARRMMAEDRVRAERLVAPAGKEGTP